MTAWCLSDRSHVRFGLERFSLLTCSTFELALWREEAAPRFSNADIVFITYAQARLANRHEMTVSNFTHPRSKYDGP